MKISKKSLILFSLIVSVISFGVGCSNSSEEASSTVPTGEQGNQLRASVVLEFTLTQDGYSVKKKSEVTITGALSIPDTYNGKPVTALGDSAFTGCTRLTSIELPASLTSIGAWAFANTGLTSITLPNSLTSIGEKAFYYCSRLTSIELPASLTSIGEKAFYYCSRLTSITLPASLTSIDEGAFANTGLTNITLPTKLASIGNYAFEGCTRLTSITLPASLTSIDEGAFANTGLTNITLPTKLASIGDSAFAGTGLTSITLPASLTSIDEGAFYDCTELTSVTVNSPTPPSLGSEVFSNCSSTLQIKVPKEAVNTYKNASGWSEYSNKIATI